MKEFQRLIEQKKDSLKSKDEELEKFRSKINDLEKELKVCEEKDTNAKNKIQALIKERGGEFRVSSKKIFLGSNLVSIWDC